VTPLFVGWLAHLNPINPAHYVGFATVAGLVVSLLAPHGRFSEHTEEERISGSRAPLRQTYRGESDKSFEWLERAYKQRDTGLPTLNTDPLFKTLRHDPRYTELLKKMRLPI
jgi:hypothetical protein